MNIEILKKDWKSELKEMQKKAGIPGNVIIDTAILSGNMKLAEEEAMTENQKNMAKEEPKEEPKDESKEEPKEENYMEEAAENEITNEEPEKKVLEEEVDGLIEEVLSELEAESSVAKGTPINDILNINGDNEFSNIDEAVSSEDMESLSAALSEMGM